MANPLNVAIKVTGLDQAKADLASFATIGKRSFNEIANEAKNFAQTAATTDPALRGVANRVRQLAAATDDAFASNLKLRQSISDVERALRAEMISAESATRMTAALRAEHEKLATSTKAVVGEIRQLETIGKISYAGITAMAQRAASAIQPTAQSTHDLALAMKELSLAADPAAAAQMRLLNGLTQVKAALDQKLISTQQAIKLEQYLREQSQAAARAEAELANKVRDAAAARAQASIQAANAQRAASQIAVAAISMEIKEMERLRDKAAANRELATPTRGSGPAAGSQAQVDLANQMRSLAAAANPLGAANLELAATFDAVDIAVKQTIIDDKQATQIKTYLRAENEKLILSLNKEMETVKKAKGHHDEAAQSVSKMNNALTQLSFQINDIGTSLASGASPFMVMAQQGGQIYQVFQMAPGGAAGVMLAFKASVLAAISPARALTTTLIAIGAAFGVVIAQAADLESRGRVVNAILKGMGDQSGVTAQNFEEMERQLRAIGISAEDAAKGLQKVLTTPGINQTQAKRLVEIGADLGVVTGEGTQTATARIAQMVSDQDVEALIALGVQYTAIKTKQAEFIRDLKEQNKTVEATDMALNLLGDHLKGTYASSMGELAKSVRDLSLAWSSFVKDAATTAFFQEGLKRMQTTIREISALLKLFQEIEDLFSKETGKAAVRNQLELNQSLVDRAKEGGGTSGVGIPEAGAERFDIKGLANNTAELQRLTKVLTEASKVLPEGFRVEATSTIATRDSGTEGHPSGRAMDVRIIGMQGPLPNQGPIGADPGLYKTLAIAVYEANKRLFADAPITWGGRFETREGSGMLDWMHFAAEEDRGRFGPPLAKLAEAQPSPPVPVPASVTATKNQEDVLARTALGYRKALEAAQAFGIDQVRRVAITNAEIAADEKKLSGKAREQFITDASVQAVRLHVAELIKQGQIQDQTTSGMLIAANAANTAAESYKSLAASEAARRVKLGTATNEEEETTRILKEQAAAAILSAQQQTSLAAPLIEAQRRVAEAAKTGGEAQRAAQVQLEASARTQDALTRATATGDQELIKRASALHEAAVAEIQLKDAADIDTQINQQDRLTKATIKAASESKTLADSYRAIAAAQADQRVSSKQANEVGAETARILNEQAAAALLSGKQSVLAAGPQIKHQELIAEAATKGAAAQHEAEVAASAAAKAQDALGKAEATRNPELIKQAKLLENLALAEEKRADAAKQNIAISGRINQRTDQIALVNQQTAMVGQLPETVEAANAKLTEQQTLINANKKLTDDISISSLKNVDALNKANIAHAEAVRQQERIDGMYKQIGSTIESAIGNVIDGIFDSKKAMDWGKAVKDMAKQMFTGIATNFFTKPLIGEVLGILGAAPTVTSQFGSFGGSTSGGGGTTTLGAQSGGTSLMGTLGQLGSLGSFAKDILGLDLKGMFSPVTDFFKDIGSGGGLFGTTPAEFIGPMQPGMSAVPGSVFGNTTMGGAFTGIAGGFAAGTMLNSLLGRKGTQQTTGMIGSGVGAIAGTLIGGPIGGIIGGLAGGGLGGLFGNPKGSNMSAGGNLDLANFKITGGFQGGDPKIDAQMAQMGQTLQGFLALLKTTGGSLSGNVLLQSGVNTGITADSSVPGYEGRFSLGKDTDTALKVIEQALVKSITGVSDTMKTVLSQVGTDEDIARAIQFAKTYEDIAKAAEDAFSSIEDATKRMGPFEATMGDIKVIFEDLTTQATRFGLALEPINKALAEATKRLQDDFLDAIELASNVANKKSYRNTIQDTIDAYLASTKEASGIGLGKDVSVGNDLGQLFTDQMKDLLSGLDESALKDVITQSFAGLDSLNPLIDSLAEAAIAQLNLAEATTAAADAAARGSAAYQAISDLLNSLQVHTSFAQSPEDAIKAANAQFFELFNAASQGSLEAMEGLAGASQDYIDAIEQYYGSSEQGQTEVSMIEKGLQDLLDMNPALKPDETTLGGVATAVEGTTTAVTAVGTAITGTSQDIIDKNNANAEALIAQNNLSTEALLADSTARLEADTALHTANTDNLIAVQDANTLAQLAYDAESAATLIGSNAEQNDLLIAQSEAAAQALVDQGNDATDLLTAAYTDSTDALIADSAAVTEKLLADAADHSEAVLSGAKDQTDALLSQAGLDQEAAKAESQAATTALLAQAALDQEAAKAESQAATKALLDQATLDKEALLDKTQKTTDTLLEGASADTVALGKVIETVGEAIIDNATDTNAANIIKAIEIMRDAITDNATDTNTANIITAIEIARDAITDNATDINAANIIKAIEIWCTTIYDQIKTWVGDNTLSTADWLNTVSVAVEDGFVYVGNLIAEWSGKIITEMGGPNGVTKTIVAGASQNAATIVQSQANIHNSWGIIYDGWMKLQVKADSDNAIFIANHNNDDMKTTVEKLNADTNAMTKLHTDLTNSLINVEDKWGKNNDGWLLSINNWTSGTYENSKTMVTRLTEIRDAIRLQNA